MQSKEDTRKRVLLNRGGDYEENRCSCVHQTQKYLIVGYREAFAETDT